MAKDRTWKDYEKEIEDHFREMYPEADIQHNVTIVGRYSGSPRQIDILITDYIAGDKFSIIIDGKFYRKRVDVKDVESFISMMQDVSASKGLMITQNGYSKAAIKRAYNDPARVELDILNFKELQKFQAFGGIPYSGKHGMLVPAPFGWVLDIEVTENWLATLFQRGKTFKQAFKSAEWMYVNILSKNDEIKSLKDLIADQDAGIKSKFPNAKFEHRSTIKRECGHTYLRIVEDTGLPGLEITGFIEFDDFIGFFVMFSPKELQEKNIKKLEYILAKTKEVKVDEQGNLRSRLASFKDMFNSATDDEQKSLNLTNQAEILILLKDFAGAESAIADSLTLLSTNYQTIRVRIDLYFKLDKSSSEVTPAIDALFNLGPANPTIWTDMITISTKYHKLDLLIEYMKHKATVIQDSEALGNLYYHLGVITEDRDESIVLLKKAENFYKGVLSKTHIVFKMIKNNLKILDK